MSTKRLVLLVEGEGDAKAVPVLVKRLLTERAAWDAVHLDPEPIQIGEFAKMVKSNFDPLSRHLRWARQRGDLGACLVLLDGDTKRKYLPGESAFCAASAARRLVEVAEREGAGQVFSFAVVFACQEYESWLVAGARSFAGRSLDAGRIRFPESFDLPTSDLELAPRDAKEWFTKILGRRYKPATDQKVLTENVELERIRQRGMRSFRRLESAVDQLIAAIRGGSPIATPSMSASSR